MTSRPLVCCMNAATMALAWGGRTRPLDATIWALSVSISAYVTMKPPSNAKDQRVRCIAMFK